MRPVRPTRDLSCLGYDLRVSETPTRTWRVRTLTAAADPEGEPGAVEAAIDFLHRARHRLERRGYAVQTLRVATPPLARWLDWAGEGAVGRVERLDEVCAQAGIFLGLGPVLDGRGHPAFPAWAAEVMRRTEWIAFAARVVAPEQGGDPGAARSAAGAMTAIAAATPGGLGNFLFAAAAGDPAGTPFFPAATFPADGVFSVGVESPAILAAAIQGAAEDPVAAMASALDRELAPLAELAREIGRAAGRRFLGIDTSPAPAPEASIGEVIETLSGRPCGAAGTVTACARITAALRRVTVETCGASGLMLPVLEDPVLARRAAQGRYGIADLLLCSTVCGTGLDVVPLPGDVPAEALERLILDVATLSARHGKPLSVRLLPIPGKDVGEVVSFDNPYLTEGVVMGLP